jgi:hypothetical protein
MICSRDEAISNLDPLFLLLYSKHQDGMIHDSHERLRGEYLYYNQHDSFMSGRSFLRCPLTGEMDREIGQCSNEMNLEHQAIDLHSK